jgi:hypothetical protein
VPAFEQASCQESTPCVALKFSCSPSSATGHSHSSSSRQTGIPRRTEIWNLPREALSASSVLEAISEKGTDIPGSV